MDPARQEDVTDCRSGVPPPAAVMTAHTLAVKQLIHTLLRSQHQLFAMSTTTTSSSRLIHHHQQQQQLEEDGWISHLNQVGYSHVQANTNNHSSLVNNNNNNNAVVVAALQQPDSTTSSPLDAQVPPPCAPHPVGYSTFPIPEYDDDGDDDDREEVVLNQTLSKEEDADDKNNNNVDQPPSKGNINNKKKNRKQGPGPHQMGKKFKKIIQKKDLRAGIRLLHEHSIANNESFQPLPMNHSLILELFYVAHEKKEPLHCDHLLNNYIYWDQYFSQVQNRQVVHQAQKQIHNEDETLGNVPPPARLEKYKWQFRQLASSFQYLDPAKHDAGKAERAVQRFITAVMMGELGEDAHNNIDKENILPRMLASMVAQKMVLLGLQHSYQLFEYMRHHDHPALKDPKYLEHLIIQARFNRRRELPYHELLREMADAEYVPRSPIPILKLLEIQYPYDDIEATQTILDSIVRMIRMQRKDGTNCPEWNFTMDMAQLECIAASCAKFGDSDTILLLWEIMDLLCLRPSQGIYEATAVTFATDATTQLELNQYSNVFNVLAEMEEQHGYVPCRALVRSLSSVFRKSNYCAKSACEAMLKALRDGQPVSIAAVNVVISSFAERSMITEVKGLMSLLMRGTKTESGRPDLVPNQDTFSFVMEGLGKNLALTTTTDHSFNEKLRIRSLIARRHQPDFDEILRDADECITRMEEQGLEPNHHFVREYVEFLCFIDDVETANNMVVKLLEEQKANNNNNKEPLVNTKTLYRLAQVNDNLGNEEIARMFASHLFPSINYFVVKESRERNAELRAKKLRARYGKRNSDDNDDDEWNRRMEESHPQGNKVPTL